jgi:site-specific DNA recombinase
LLSGEVGSVAELARTAGVNSRYVVRTVRMGFLAPDIIEAILEGRQTAAVTFEIFRQPLPLDCVKHHPKFPPFVSFEIPPSR